MGISLGIVVDTQIQKEFTPIIQGDDSIGTSEHRGKICCHDGLIPFRFLRFRVLVLRCSMGRFQCRAIFCVFSNSCFQCNIKISGFHKKQPVSMV